MLIDYSIARPYSDKRNADTELFGTVGYAAPEQYGFSQSDFRTDTGLLHTPPHDGRTCLSLTVPTAKSVVDFHHQVTAHSGQTNKRSRIFLRLLGRKIFYEGL